MAAGCTTVASWDPRALTAGWAVVGCGVSRWMVVLGALPPAAAPAPPVPGASADPCHVQRRARGA